MDQELSFGWHDALRRAAEEYKACENTRGPERDKHLAIAKEITEQLVREDPDSPMAYAMLGCLHFTQKDYGSALACHGMALDRAQRSGQMDHIYWYNLANTFGRTHHKAAAEFAYDQALAMEPGHPETLANLSGHWVAYGDGVKAEEFARRALTVTPDSTLARLHLGFALLMQGRWQEGWPYLEVRKERADRWGRGKYPMLEWDGKAFDGTVIIHGEQGLGDELFYCSLVRRVQALVCRVVVECSERLVPLLRRSLTCEVYGSLEEAVANGVMGQEVLDEHAKGITIDGNCEWPARPRIAAMGSLPMLLGVSEADCADSAYLRADPFRTLWYRAKLEAIANGRPIVGVAWVGGHYETHKILRNPPRELFTRLDPEKYCLVSVQYTEGAREQAARMGMVHFQAAIDSLDEQAALIKALDCMVSVAQTAMHIAGGLDVPTFALISQYPKWDCGRAGEDTLPWWASVKTLRQTSDDWQPVFDKLLAELGEGTEDEVRALREKAVAEFISRRAERFGSPMTAVPDGPALDLSTLSIGAPDAQTPNLGAAAE